VDALLYVRAAPGAAGRILTELPSRPGVRRAVLVVGDWDVIAVVEAPDMAAIATIILTDIQQIEGVERTRTAPMVPPDRLGVVGGGLGLASHPQLLPGDACYVHVRAQPGTVPSLYERLSELESVTGVAALAGRFDLLVEIRRPWDIASGVILDQVQTMPGILATETMVGLDYQEPEEDRDQFSSWS
jgi:DNA-binding Lrp family transcriptional regulator